MKNGCFVPWEDYRPVLHTFNCPCCAGGMKMPTEEELEQLAIALIDREEPAAAILIEDRHIEKRDVRL